MKYVTDKLGLSSEDGTALVIALLFLVVLGITSSALVTSVQGEMNTSVAYKYAQQAFYTADGGVQKAVLWFNTNYTPHVPAVDYDYSALPVEYNGADVLLAGQNGSSSVFPTASTATNFASAFHNQSLVGNSYNSGDYAVNASLVKYWPARFIDPNTFLAYASAVERWQIDSFGYWGGVANPIGRARITATIENNGNALFDRAIWGIDRVDMGGTALLDSYNPLLGPYGGANVGDLGAMASNGDVDIGGTVDIYGDLAYGPTGSFSTGGGSVNVTGQISQLPQEHYFYPIPNFSVGSVNINIGGNSTASINPGSYRNVSALANSVLTLNPGTYYIDSLSIGAQAKILVTGPTTIFVKSNLDLNGQGLINLTQDPGNMTIFYSGTNSASLVGGSGFYGSVYAPNAVVTLRGNAEFYGSFIGREVNNVGTIGVHFDEGGLKRNLVQRPFRIITWSQNVY